jgi:hypothetical protein
MYANYFYFVLPFLAKALKSKKPSPERLNKMTFSFCSALAARASSIVAATAWEDSGAGRIPSVLKKNCAASNHGVLL